MLFMVYGPVHSRKSEIKEGESDVLGETDPLQQLTEFFKSQGYERLLEWPS
jgi:hypothetical protein